MAFSLDQGNEISVANSTTALLGAGATFTGAWENVVDFNTVSVAILGSAPTDGTLFFDLSTDGGATFTSVPSTVGDITFAVPRILNVVEDYVRMRYVNGATPQTGTWSLRTKYAVNQQMTLLSSVDGFVDGETPTQVVRSVVTGVDPDGVYRNVVSTRNGNLAVSIADADLDFKAIVTPGGGLKIAEQTHLVGSPFGGSPLSADEWAVTLVGSGTQDATLPGELAMQTGAIANSSVEIQTESVARFIPANYNTTHHAVTIPDGAAYAANNSRKWGAIDFVTGNGVYYEIENGVWYVVHCINNVHTRVIQGSWNGAGVLMFPTNSITSNVYEIEYNAGSIIYRVNGNVMHRANLLAMPYANSIHFPAGMSNTNTGGSTTDVSLKLRAAAIFTLGKGKGDPRPKYIAGTTAGVLLKAGPGHLGKVIFARAGGGGGSATILIYDALSAVNQVGRIDISRDDTIPIDYDFIFSTGLFVAITGTGTLGTTITFD